MRKLLFELLTIVAGILFFATPVVAAAPTVSVNIEQPKTPSNQTSFNVTFVALTTTGNAVTVKCFKQGPSDGSFTQFGSDITLSAGGNTNACQVNSSIITTDGTYNFYVTANDGTNTVTSDTVSVKVDTTSPDAPTAYTKTQLSSCQYKIHFHTAPDNGKTVKVEVYRSENNVFNADAGTRVASIAIGSDSDYDYTDNVGDCSKTYYYAIRAFNASGNGSSVVGDNDTHTITTTINPTATPAQGAIPVTGSNVSNEENGSSVLGTQSADTDQNTTTAKKDVLGTNKAAQIVHTVTSSKKAMASIIFVVLVILALLFAVWRRMKKAKQTATLKMSRRFDK